MAATNAIGTGAVVLTANADRLLAGLDRAEKATEKSAGKIAAKATDAGAKGGGGGLLSAAIFGGAAGAAFAGVNAVIGKIDQIIGRIQNVGETVKAYSGIDTARFLRIDRAQKAFDRITAASDDFYFRIAERIAPIIEKVASVIEVIGFVGSEAFDALADSTERAFNLFADLVGVTDEFGAAGESAVDRTLKALRFLAKGLASIEQLFGKIGMAAIDGLGASLQPIASLLRVVDAATGSNLSERAAAEYDRVLKLRDEFARASADSFAEIDAWFDRKEREYKETNRIRKMEGVKLAGAFDANSNDVASILAKNQAANILSGKTNPDNPLKVAKDQLKELKDVKRAINKLVDRGDRAVPLEIVP